MPAGLLGLASPAAPSLRVTAINRQHGRPPGVSEGSLVETKNSCRGPRVLSHPPALAGLQVAAR